MFRRSCHTFPGVILTVKSGNDFYSFGPCSFLYFKVLRWVQFESYKIATENNYTRKEVQKKVEAEWSNFAYLKTRRFRGW